MISNRRMQNSRYRQASSGKNIGSKTTKAQAGQADRTYRKRNVSQPGKRGVIGKLNNNSRNIRGSREGLDTAKTARVAGNNGGYNNPSRQRARYESLTLKDGLPSTKNISNPASRLGILNKNVFDGTFKGPRGADTARSLMDKRLKR